MTGRADVDRTKSISAELRARRRSRRPEQGATVRTSQQPVRLRARTAIASLRARKPAVLLLLISLLLIGAAAALLGLKDLRAAIPFVAAALLLALVAKAVRPRGLLGASLLFLVAPGVFGEASSIISATALLLFILVAALTRPSRSIVDPRTAWIGVGGLVAVGLASVLVGVGQVLVLFLLSGALLLLLNARRELGSDVLRGVAFILGLLTVSYSVTLLTGFGAQVPLVTFVGERLVNVWAPMTLTTLGPPFIPGGPRFIPLVGEPGLAVYFLVPAAVAIVTSTRRLRARIPSAMLVAAGACFTQSTGLLITLIGSALLAIVLSLVRARRWLPAIAICGGAVASIALLLPAVLLWKSKVASVSITDRGLGQVGKPSPAALGNINLLVTFRHDPWVAVLILVGLLALLLVAGRQPIGLAVVLAFAVTATFNEPSQWQPGGWLLALICLILLRGQAVDRIAKHRDQRLLAAMRSMSGDSGHARRSARRLPPDAPGLSAALLVDVRPEHLVGDRAKRVEFDPRARRAPLGHAAAEVSIAAVSKPNPVDAVGSSPTSIR